MSCEKHLSELWEAALGAVPSAAFAAHLTECEACRAQLEAERQLAQRLDGELRAALQVSPSLGFRAGALRRAEERERRRAWRAWWWLASAAALLFLSMRPFDRPERERAARHEARAAEAPRPALAGGPSVPAIPTTRPARVRVVETPAPHGVEPEVLVPPDQALLLRRLVERLEAPSAQMSWFAGRDSLASGAQPIDVTPIRVSPLSLEKEVVQPLRIEASLESAS